MKKTKQLPTISLVIGLLLAILGANAQYSITNNDTWIIVEALLACTGFIVILGIIIFLID